MDGGCRGFAKEVMSWPEDLIIGGVKKTQGHLSAAEALQSVILVASANDVYLRFKVLISTIVCPNILDTLSNCARFLMNWEKCGCFSL